MTDHLIGQKGAKFARCVAVFLGGAELKLTSWFKVSTTRRAVNKGAQFSVNFCSNYRWITI